MSSPQAFDHLAAGYDSAFTGTTIGRYLRGRAQARLGRHFRPGDRALELGCGTGEDALWLAGRGVSVLATDASEAMLDITRAKAADCPLVRVERLDLHALPADQPASGAAGLPFDGAFASFGPLNCLDDWRPLAAWLAARIRPGGVAAFGVMSPLCLWEVAWHGLHGDLKTAFRRWRGATAFQPHESAAPVMVWYPTLRRLSRDFAPYFRRAHVEGLGLFLPPSDAFGAVERRPRLLRLLLRLEARFAPVPQLALLADHYWVEFERN